MFTFFSFKTFYLFTERERTQAEEGAEREADSPRSKEPDAGLDPKTLESLPELKADA